MPSIRFIFRCQWIHRTSAGRANSPQWFPASPLLDQPSQGIVARPDCHPLATVAVMNARAILFSALLTLALAAVPPSPSEASRVRPLVRQAVAPAKCRNAECCALTKAELRVCDAAGDTCTGSEKAGLEGLLSTVPNYSCQNCPIGQCRVGTACMCSTSFLNHADAKESCITSHGAVYPGSVGHLDASRRKCRPATASPIPIPKSCNRRACCEMNLNDINVCLPHSDRCLTEKPGSIPLDNVCHDCPPGECRLGIECVCLKNFLETKMLRDGCITTHGKSWPALPGAVDRDRAKEACPSPTPAPSPSKGAGVSSRNIPGTKVPAPGSKGVQESDSRQMSRGELWGIIIGGIGALAGVAGVLATILKQYEFIETKSDPFSSYPVDG